MLYFLLRTTGTIPKFMKRRAPCIGSRIILSADSTCDLGDELKARYAVHYYPFHVILDGQTYADGVDLMPDDIYRVYREKKILPKTAAINTAEYIDYFRQWTDQGYEVIHLNLGSGLSATHNNCRLAAEELPGVYVIDSCNLSTGSGLLVLEAADRIAAGMPAAQIAQEVRALTSHAHASFVLDTLEFLYKGGRCSALAMLAGICHSSRLQAVRLIPAERRSSLRFLSFLGVDVIPLRCTITWGL